MLPESCGISFSDQMQKFWNRASANHSIQVNRFIISFHPDELDPDDPRDQLAALDIGVEFAKTNCPHSQSAIFLQNDGTGHKLHLHVVGVIAFGRREGPDLHIHGCHPFFVVAYQANLCWNISDQAVIETEL